MELNNFYTFCLHPMKNHISTLFYFPLSMLLDKKHDFENQYLIPNLILNLKNCWPVLPPTGK